MKRPDLQIALSSKEFESYYYLKSELTEFCKKNDLQTSGSKEAINNRISHFLSTGEKLIAKTKVNSKKSSTDDVLSLDSIIAKDFICSQQHRYFFKEVMGKHFTFNTEIQNWFTENEGKTYNDAVKVYKEILEHKKKNKTTITKQFEYNTYIREFFADNKEKFLKDAIECWKYKKGCQVITDMSQKI